MQKQIVTVTRIYVTESEKLLSVILTYLKEAKISGFTVFRAIEGGSGSKTQNALFVDLSLDLPLVIEFFDADESKVSSAITHVLSISKPKHVISWKAEAFTT